VEWVVVALAVALIALGAFTAYRLVRSWRIAHDTLDAIDPPRSGSP
jgi:hypothetical protein